VLLFLLNPSAFAKNLLIRAGGKVVPRDTRRALVGDDDNVRTVRVPTTTSFVRARTDRRFLEGRVLSVV